MEKIISKTNKVFFNIRDSSLLSLILLSLFSCDESTLVTTQKEPPIFRAENKIDTLLADGKSVLSMSLVFSRTLSPNENVVLTTNNGKLLEFPEQDISKGTNQLNVKPSSKKFNFLLVASNKPSEQVFLRAKINDLVSSHKIVFKRVCPEQINFKISHPSFSINSDEKLLADLSLLNTNFALSDSTQIELSLSNDSLVSLTNEIYFYSKPINFEIQKLGKRGEVTISAKVTQSGCKTLESSKRIKFF